MSGNVPPNLNQYFGPKQSKLTSHAAVDLADEVEEATNKVEDLHLQEGKKNEPEVCRLFTENPTHPKDPTAAFFDLIGNSSSAGAVGSISTDLDLPMIDVSLQLLYS